MADFAGGAIQAFVGPTELGAADDLDPIIVGFIDEAQESLDIAVQEIDSEIIAQAILDARWRGVSVRVFRGLAPPCFVNFRTGVAVHATAFG